MTEIVTRHSLEQELHGGWYCTCIWWNYYSMQCRSSKKWVMVYAWKVVYARFNTHSHRFCRDMHFNSRLDIKFGQSQWSMKCRSRAPCHSKWLLSVSRTITMQGFILPAITAAEKCTLFLDSTTLEEREMSVKGTTSWCVVVKCIKDNKYSRYHTPRYHCRREMHFISRLKIKFWQSLWGMKCRSRAPGQGAWL